MMTHGADDYALVIGINDYPLWNEGAKSLKGPVDDATSFRDWLIADRGGGLPEANVKLIVSACDPPEPRQQVIDDAFAKIRKQSAGKTRRRFYFFFSGHGHSPAGADRQSLCLANWSPDSPNAALQLESYITAAKGCLKFAEVVCFLDCCRVRAIVPPGHPSDLECAVPDMRGRYSAVMFGSDQLEPTFEGDVDDQIRGYFTAGLIKVLNEGTIEFGDLLRRLRVLVPKLASPKGQVVRAIPADTDIYFGPPGPRPPTPVYVSPTGTAVAISLTTNLSDANLQDDEPYAPPPPSPGTISILRDDLLVAFGAGRLTTSLLPGRYQVRVDHGEASTTRDLDVADRPVALPIDLPRRASASLLSSTIGKREERTNPAIMSSRWDATNGGQAVFVGLRPLPSREANRAGLSENPITPRNVAGVLRLAGEFGHRPVTAPNALLRDIPRGTARLIHDHPDGTTSLPIPVAAGWDTQVFILVDKGKPNLATASVSMRPAGAGFDPSDALTDAYERAIADLVTGGPGPDPATLDNLLFGKYRNPLFGLLGAYFLVRKLRRDAVPAAYELDRLALVTANLGTLLGADAPDVVALRLWRQLILGEEARDMPGNYPPLFNVGFQAFVEATALFGGIATPEIDRIALGLDANSPWTIWRADHAVERPMIAHHYATETTSFRIGGADPLRIGIIEKLWQDNGFAVDAIRVGGRLELSATRTGGDNHFDLAARADMILSVPQWLVDYMRDAIDQARRTGVELDYKRLVRRTMLPLNVIKAAELLAQGEIGDLATRTNESVRNATSEPTEERGKEEDDGEVAAGAT